MQTSAFGRRTLLAAGGGLLAGAWRGAAAQPPAPPLPPLAAQIPLPLAGITVVPGMPGYDAARPVFNSRFDRRPAAVVFCRNVADVQEAVRWARRTGMPFRARSGGHSYEGLSTLNGGVVADLSALNWAQADPASGIAVVGAGARLLDVATALAGQGVVLPAGTCPGVGIAGLALGGGIGYYARAYGLTCDRLREVQVVDATGSVLTANSATHPDLFWALRGGGGGNFGVATSFTFDTVPLRQVVLVEVAWHWPDAAAVVDAWQRWAPTVDSRLSTSLAIFGQGADLVSLRGLFTGADAEVGALLAPILATGTPSSVSWWAASTLDAATYLGGTPTAHATFKNSSAIAERLLGPEAIAALLARLAAPPNPWNLVSFFALGGAVAAVDPTATAFPHRRALFDLQYQAYWSDPGLAAAQVGWVRDARLAMAPFTNGAYVNYLDLEIDDWATAYYGPNRRRLRQVKTAYDPGRFFHAPQGIRPL